MHKMIFEQLQILLEKLINKNQYFVICGHMNINLLEQNSITSKLKSFKLFWSKMVI